MSAEAFSLCLNRFSVATLQIWRRCVSCWGSSSRCWRGRSATAQWRLKWRKSPLHWMWPRLEADLHLFHHFHLLITHTHTHQRAISSRWLALLAADSVPLLHDNVCIIDVQYSSWKFKCRSYFQGWWVHSDSSYNINAANMGPVCPEQTRKGFIYLTLYFCSCMASALCRRFPLNQCSHNRLVKVCRYVIKWIIADSAGSLYCRFIINSVFIHRPTMPEMPLPKISTVACLAGWLPESMKAYK